MFQEVAQIASHLEQNVDPSFIAKAKVQAIECMRQCDGWCSESKGAILVDIILRSRPHIILEIGVWGGKSLVPMASALKSLGQGVAYGIDPWDNMASIEETTEPANINFWAQVDHKGVKRTLEHRIDAFGLSPYIRLIETTSEHAEPIQNIDILHIDGNHSDKTSYFDTMKWVPLVRSGGWIIFDDMTWHESGKFTTARAVEWLNSNCIKVAEFTDSCQWGLWIKP